MIRQKQYNIFLILVLLFGVSAQQLKAQVTVSVKMDTVRLLIGDQTKLRMEAVFPASALVGFPIFADTIIKNLEIVNIANPDTVKENGNLKVTQEYTVTSFDAGTYEVPPMNFTVGFPKSGRLDTLLSVPVYFIVMTMPLDTITRNAIADIKKPIEAPLTMAEVWPYVGYGLAVLVILFLAYFLYMKFARKKPIFEKREIPKEPAHIIALRSLDALNEEKVWQRGELKEYYSRLTEVVRRYIEDRFQIPAMESTSDDIIDAFRSGGLLTNELKNDLFDTLVRADFVKFAKATTLADENEESMKFAYNFVLKTKPVEILREEDEIEKGD